MKRRTENLRDLGAALAYGTAIAILCTLAIVLVGVFRGTWV